MPFCAGITDIGLLYFLTSDNRQYLRMLDFAGNAQLSHEPFVGLANVQSVRSPKKAAGHDDAGPVAAARTGRDIDVPTELEFTLTRQLQATGALLGDDAPDDAELRLTRQSAAAAKRRAAVWAEAKGAPSGWDGGATTTKFGSASQIELQTDGLSDTFSSTQSRYTAGQHGGTAVTAVGREGRGGRAAAPAGAHSDTRTTGRELAPVDPFRAVGVNPATAVNLSIPPLPSQYARVDDATKTTTGFLIPDTTDPRVLAHEAAVLPDLFRLNLNGIHKMTTEGLSFIIQVRCAMLLRCCSSC